MRRPLALAGAVAAAVIQCPAASAADKSPVSTLPILPAPRGEADAPKGTGVPGLSVKTMPGRSPYLEINASTSRGYCLVSKEYGLRLDPSGGEPFQHELWRFVETGNKARLERTRFEVVKDEATAWVKSRASVELVAVARASGLTVWAYREENGDIVLLARGADGGRETSNLRKEEDGTVPFVFSSCGFGATRLSGRLARSGAVAMLRGVLPPRGEGKAKVTPRFVVNGTVAKLTRDPEPVLAVRIGIIDA